MSSFHPFFLLLLTASPLFSQATSTSGDLRGTIVDPSGNPLPLAKLTVINADGAFSRSTISASEGRFTLTSIPPGIYKLRAEADGFTLKLIENIEIRVGDVVSLLIQLPISAIQSEIVVTADISSVEVERTQQANTIEQTRINNLPINRRNYLDFALLAPGVVETTSLVDDSSYRPAQTPNSGLSFGGSNGRGNGFFIDGLENFSNAGGGVEGAQISM